jgi:hypothetical protein
LCKLGRLLKFVVLTKKVKQPFILYGLILSLFQPWAASLAPLAKHSTSEPMVKGLNPATACNGRKWRKEMKKLIIYLIFYFFISFRKFLPLQAVVGFKPLTVGSQVNYFANCANAAAQELGWI